MLQILLCNCLCPETLHIQNYRIKDHISNLVHDNHIHNDSEYYFSKMNHLYINSKLRFLCEAKYTMSQI